MPTRRFYCRAIVVLAVLVSSALSALTVAASAAPIDDKRRLAAQLEADINAAAEQLAVLNEQVKGVQLRLDEAQGAIVEAEVAIATARQERERLLALVRRRAQSVYLSVSKGGGFEMLELDLRSVVRREKYAAAANDRDDSIAEALVAAQRDLRARQREAEEARSTAMAERQMLETTRTEFAAVNDRREEMLAQVQGEVAQLVAEETARRQAREAPRSQGGQAFDPGQLPSPSGDVAAVIAFAKAQLGKPYQYGAAGPDSYDCSGLTMAAWAQAGVRLPHNDVAQMSRFPRVPIGQVQPGDLVWYPGHIALYVGGGAVIVAPRTGDVVKYQSVSLYREAVRPG